MLKKFVIERQIPGVGDLNPRQLGEVAKTSNAALARLPGVQWQQSFITKDGTICIYLAESEAAIRDHARLSGFPANRIVEVTGMIDPATEQQCAPRAWT
jgi:hypothetical protein